MSDKTFQEIVLIESAFVFQPLVEINSQESVIRLLDKLGYKLTLANFNRPADLSGMVTIITALMDAVIELANATTDDERKAALANIIQKLAPVIAEVQNFITIFQNGVVVGNFLQQAPVDQLPKRLIDYLFVNYLFKRQPKIFGTLFLMGVIDEEALAANPFQRTGNIKTIKWERIPTWFSAPRDVINELYTWDTDFNAQKFLDRFQLFLQAMAVPGGIYKQSERVKNALGNTTADLPEIRIPILTTDGDLPGTYGQLGLNLTTAEARAAENKLKGLALVPYLTGTASIDAPLSENWKLQLKGKLEADALFGIVLRPPLKVEAFENIFSDPSAAGTLELFLSLLQQKDASGKTKKIYVFGDSTNTRFTLDGISTTAFVKSSPDKQDAGIEAEIKEMELVILPGDDGDSFLAKILPAEGIQAKFGFGIGVSVQNGFYFKGASNIEILIPVHIQLGPISIQNVVVGIGLEDRKVPIALSATIGAELGPLKAVVENIGIKVILSFPPNRDGNLGPVNAQLEFKPPNGVGISLDTGVVKGGGYLRIDAEKGEYAGMLELTIKNFLALTAIGLITTKKPDGTPSFSMLIIITAEFSPALQLGYGFTLNGVGGLLGINRIVLLDPLRDGVRTGALNGILFPRDVVANAPRIINDLKTIFPPQEGSFLIGPMAKLGWGTPTLISLSLGVIIQLPDPKIAILGVLKMVLPTEEAAVLKMQVNFLGTIDPAQQLITFDASLYDSHLLKVMTLTGDMILRLKWGNRPDFIFSAGGVHPDFTPTVPVPKMERLGIKILDKPNARIAVQTYFAVTSNTVQIGAKADCYFGMDGFSVSGDLGFDALIQFSPFQFVATAGAQFTLETWLGDAGISIRATLKGPTPWHVNARGAITVFGKEFEVPFEKTWGESNTDLLPSIAIKDAFIASLLKDESWHSEIPPGKVQLVAVNNPLSKEPAPRLRVFPYSILVISQKFAPLDTQLEQLGNKSISDHHKVTIQSVALGIATAVQEPVRDLFAAAQFKKLSDADKLSRPSFEQFNSGVKAYYSQQGVSFRQGATVRREQSYEPIIIDIERTVASKKWTLSPERYKDMLKHHAAKASKLSMRRANDLGKRTGVVRETTPEKAFTIVDIQQNLPISAEMSFDNQTLAKETMDQLILANPALKNQITIQSVF